MTKMDQKLQGQHQTAGVGSRHDGARSGHQSPGDNINDDGNNKEGGNDELVMTKKHKGRLKKLRRRADDATSVSSRGGGGRGTMSGIISHADADELRQLTELDGLRHGRQSGEGRKKTRRCRSGVNDDDGGKKNDDAGTFGGGRGPSVLLTANSDQSDLGEGGERRPHRQSCEGVDHRDLLLRVLFHDGGRAGVARSSSACASASDSVAVEGGAVANGRPSKKRKREHRNAANGDDDGGGDGDGSKIDNHEAQGDAAAGSDDMEFIRRLLPPTPSWANVHNPALATHAAVIEFSIEVGDDDGREGEHSPDIMMPSSSILSPTSSDEGDIGDDGEENEEGIHEESDRCRMYPTLRALVRNPGGLHGRRATPPLRTRLFQGDRWPREMSDVLMYVDDPNRKNVDDNRQGEGGASNGPSDDAGGGKVERSRSSKSAYDLLRTLVLSESQLVKERYPRLGVVVKRDDDDDSNNVKAPRTIVRERSGKEMGGGGEGRSGGEGNAEDEGEGVSDPPNSEEDATTRTAITASSCISPMEEVGIDADMKGVEAEDEYLSTVFTRRFNGAPSPLGDVDLEVCPPPRVFALDCEMVRTTAGSELARVTLLRHEADGERDGITGGAVGAEASTEKDGGGGKEEDDETYSVIMDIFVNPRATVVDYLTDYSGITPRLLDGVEARVEDARDAFLRHVRGEDVVVGHSLENDLHALHVAHGNVVDTSVLFRGDDGRKHALRHLSKVLLNRDIQASRDGNGGIIGHCSEEDAAASLALALRRARRGGSFRLRSKSHRRRHLMELIDAARKRKCAGGGDGSVVASSSPSHIVRGDGPLVCVGGGEWIRRHVPMRSSVHSLVCESIASPSRDAIVAWMKSERRRASLLWANLEVAVTPKGCRQIDDTIVSCSPFVGSQSRNEFHGPVNVEL